MPAKPRYKEYNEIDFGEVDPLTMDQFVQSVMQLNENRNIPLKDVMNQESPVSLQQNPQVGNDVDSDILSKIKSLETDFTRKPTPRRPTSIMDVIDSLSQVVGGGKSTDSGGKDFLGGIMDTLDKIGGYASSGQGTSLLGAITGNRGMIDSGLKKLSDESQYSQLNDEDAMNSAKNALDYYKTVGSMSGGANKGQYLTPFTYYDENSGVYRKGLIDTTAKDASKAFIKSPDGPIVAPEQAYIDKNPDTGETYSYGRMSGKTQSLTPKQGAFTPNETKDLTARSNSLIASQAKTLDVLGSVRNAKGLVNSTHGLVSLQNMLSTAAGDPGNKSVADREGITGPNAFLGKIKNYYSMSVDGKLPPEGQEYVLDLIDKYEQAAINKINSEVEINKQAFLSLHPNADPVEVDKHTKRIVAKQISDINERNKKAITNKKSTIPAKTPPTTSKPANKKAGVSKKSNEFTSNKGKTYTLKDPRTK